ncbi:MAG: NAD-dependent epimerase/dehydratase family protein [Proteobacteria bacterium]|nr:NAD-dependent epimerase/dehydratase family protein [Pseudomonadota bacterium]
MAEALQGVEIVYHLISTTVPGTSNLNPVVDINDNLVATVVLLDQMIKMGVKRIVYLSSGGTVYGKPHKVPIAEEHPLNPICSYGVVKVAIENYLHMYQELYGLRPTIIRPSNPFGPRQGHEGVQGVIATFIAKIFLNQSLNVWGDGSVIRDYMYVTDLARLCIVAGEENHTGVFNAGSGQGISISSIIKQLEVISGKKPSVSYEPGRNFDVKEMVLDINHTKNITGWCPTVDLTNGLLKHWNWYTSLPQHF